MGRHNTRRKTVEWVVGIGFLIAIFVPIVFCTFVAGMWK